MAQPVYDYFFSGNKYIRVKRGETGAGITDIGPSPVSDWKWPSGFGANGIDAALYSGSVCYFFKGTQYIVVTRGITNLFAVGANGQPEIAGPFPISNWKWPNGFGKNGIDAALWSGTVTYFFSGNQYIRVSRKSDTDFGITDPQYPRSILAGWGWENVFNQGVKGALPSGSRCYFFHGNEYIRVSRGFELGGFIEAGYPQNISGWEFPSGFGADGIDAALYSGGPLANPGSGGQSSNFNYVLTNNGANITDLSVSIRIDNDFISPTTATGFNFQLNCESAPSSAGPNIPYWQQFIFDNHAKDVNIFGWINLWAPGNNGNDPSFGANTPGSFVLPAENTIKAGSVLTIAPVFNSSDQITSCNFSYTDPTGKTSTMNATTGPNIAPITSVTVNIGGENNGALAAITSGQGTITYTAATQLTATASNAETAEESNIVYEPLPPIVNVSQLFGTAPTALTAQENRKIPEGKVLLRLPPRPAPPAQK